ncbi:MAG: deoxyguanosinetriphosphate triphosphohydrolase, partial [Rhodospirillaceae bacterium]|nr:deoxyguanosinetriphosphate triphosphohydrolase [Rhodospirillaceae bacterium]
VHSLFGPFFDRPDALPLPWRRRTEAGGEARRARIIADYIAGMTDRFALNEHDRLIAAER